MKRVKYIALAAATVALTGVAGSAVAATGIAATKHNLSTSGPAGYNGATNGTTEICVFCHTPHGANSSQSVPLWNRAMSAPGVFTTYAQLGSATLDGSITDVGSVSLACLSCHDGQVAMDNLLNAPGSGGYNSTGTDQGWTFETGTNASSTMSAGGKLTAGIALIGTDLRDDHPVGILYAGGNVAGNEASPSTYKDPDFKEVTPVTINTDSYWYVETGLGNATARDRQDMILYSRNVWGGDKPFVECASCHDPHVDKINADEVMFLRMSNHNSALCLACHVK